jgi:hypothetical protein
VRKLIVLVAAVALVAVGAQSALAGTDEAAIKGFFRGKTVEYLDFGPVKLAPGNKVAPIWAFTNGTRAQHNIIDTVPGRDDYTPLWKVTMLTWKPGVAPRTLKSAAAVRAALRAGRLTAKRTNVVVNCPVLGFGQPLTAGFAKGNPIQYLDLGPIKLRPGNKVAPIWVVTNGTADQANVVDTVPGDADYTPLWAVVMVTWKDGVTPRTLRSKADVDAALAAGEVTLMETDTVVNCPVVQG